jgi:hypothetical protein
MGLMRIGADPRALGMAGRVPTPVCLDERVDCGPTMLAEKQLRIVKGELAEATGIGYA